MLRGRLAARPATSAISTSTGRIVITDRKKDLIVNDKGDNVAPQRVEGMLTLQPEIAQAMVDGDRRPHLVGLLVPDAEYRRRARRCCAMPTAVGGGRPGQRRPVVIEKVRRFILADEPSRSTMSN